MAKKKNKQKEQKKGKGKGKRKEEVAVVGSATERKEKGNKHVRKRNS